MAIHFSDTGLTADEAATIRAEVAADWKEAFKIDETTPELNTEPETPAGQLIDGITALVMQKDNELIYLGNQFNPETATGAFQDALGKIYFIERRVAQPTLVTCTCLGLSGTQIPNGAIVQDTAGNQFASTNAAVIGSNGSVDVVFACTEPGAITVNADSVTKIVTVIPGWDSVNNTAPGVTGRTVETQSEFERRRYDSVAANSHGLAESVGGTVAGLDGVVACKIVQNRENENQTINAVVVPPHSVYLSVYGGEADDIGMALHNKLDAGCGTAGNTSVTIADPTNNSLHLYYYTVPTVTPVYVKVTTAPDVLYNADTVKQAILNNFNGLLPGFSQVIMGDELYSSRFYQTAIDAGLNGLVKIEVSTNNSTFDLNVSFDLNQMPTLASDNITFVEVEDDG